jgi:hypothetical protein
MALQKLQFRPGVNKDQTNYTNEGGWFSCDKIRFRSSYPQKIGGWLKSTIQNYLGVCRSLFVWIASSGENILAVGTNIKAYVEAGNNLYDITPIRVTFTTASTPSSNNCIDVVNGSTTVTINITGHGMSTGSYVTISGAAAVGGVPADSLNQEFAVTVVDQDNFTIVVNTAATSTVSNGGGTSIVVACQINIGPVTTIYGYGWGAGAWGRLGWGSGSIIPIATYQRDWWFDNFDNDLVMNIRNGAIYYWTFDGTFTSRAVLLSSIMGATDVPAEAMQIMTSQGDKHLLAFGATPYGGGDFDPLLIRWSDQDDPINWTPAPTNSAGFLRVSRGSRIIRAIATRQETLVFTDATLSSLQFLGTTDVFGIQEMSDNISISGPRAVATANNTVYWMGTDKFYAYSGRVETLPCSLRNHVFSNINFDQMEQIVSGTNEGWNEIWWFYPTADSNVNNAYVIYNHLERIWYYGFIERTAWNDSPLRQYPQAAGQQIIYNHEQGIDDNGLPMESFITSSDFDITDGDEFMLIKRILPDIDFTGSTAEAPEILLTMRPRNFPGSVYKTEPNERVIETAVDVYTDQVFIRARARQMGFKILSTDLGVQWQLGSPRLDSTADGQR